MTISGQKFIDVPFARCLVYWIFVT